MPVQEREQGKEQGKEQVLGLVLGKEREQVLGLVLGQVLGLVLRSREQLNCSIVLSLLPTRIRFSFPIFASYKFLIGEYVNLFL